VNILVKASLALAISFSANWVQASPVENLSAEMSKQIVAAADIGPSSRFDGFLAQTISQDFFSDKPVLVHAVEKYRASKSLSDGELHVLQRLLGLYTRVKHGHDAMNTLAQLVAIPTFRVDGVEQHDNPEFHKFSRALAAIAEDFNLAFRNVDDRVYEVSLKGSSNEVVGIHAHADVVPVTPSLWQLEDGTKLDPFKLTRLGNRMYGRGTEDDKNGIVVSMYAMKVIQEENIPLMRNIHLLVDTTEETSSDAIPYYFSKNPTPNYNLALDGGYPVVIAEKGTGSILANFPERAGEKNKNATAEIIAVSGGLAINQIPGASVAVVTTPEPKNLAVQLNKMAKAFVSANGGNFSIVADAREHDVELTVKGVSAHSSEPSGGVNPVSRMFMFIEYTQQKKAVFKFNHVTDAASYIAANWGLDFHGKTIGIDFSHDFMGPLTSSVTLVSQNNSTFTVGVNLRVPVGRDSAVLKQHLTERLSAWQSDKSVALDISIALREPMYRNPKGPWVNALLDVATENLSMPREFGSSAGATSVHNLPNGVQFGLAMPSKKYTGHNANEFKRVEQFLLDLQIITEMVARVGQMPNLE